MAQKTMLATVTATKDDGPLEENGDVTRSDLCSLMRYADEIVLHEVHDEMWCADVKRRYPDRWDAKVDEQAPVDETTAAPRDR